MTNSHRKKSGGHRGDLENIKIISPIKKLLWFIIYIVVSFMIICSAVAATKNGFESVNPILLTAGIVVCVFLVTLILSSLKMAIFVIFPTLIFVASLNFINPILLIFFIFIVAWLIVREAKDTNITQIISDYKNWIELSVYLLGALVVMMGISLATNKNTSEGMLGYGSASLLISIIFAWILLPALGLIKISRGQKHPAEDYSEFLKFVLIQSYTKKSGIICSIFVLAALIVLGDIFSLGNSSSLDGRYAWLPFTGLTFLVSSLVFLAIFGNFSCFVGRIFDKKVKTFSEYALNNIKSATLKKVGGRGLNIGGFYFGWMFFKIQIASAFLMILFFGHEFRPAAFFLLLLFCIPDFYKIFLSKK